MQTYEYNPVTPFGMSNMTIFNVSGAHLEATCSGNATLSRCVSYTLRLMIVANVYTDLYPYFSTKMSTIQMFWHKRKCMFTYKAFIYKSQVAIVHRRYFVWYTTSCSNLFANVRNWQNLGPPTRFNFRMMNTMVHDKGRHLYWWIWMEFDLLTLYLL